MPHRIKKKFSNLKKYMDYGINTSLIILKYGCFKP